MISANQRAQGNKERKGISLDFGSSDIVIRKVRLSVGRALITIMHIRSIQFILSAQQKFQSPTVTDKVENWNDLKYQSISEIYFDNVLLNLNDRFSVISCELSLFLTQ